ncbi:MAG: helicase C-terminal domain-containing protein [Syntrophomonas sp.]|nr:helicase C-terminal domain-containing protein [Syntrophomonas sp.]
MNNYQELVESLMKPGGKMEQCMEGFVHRKEQIHFASAVARAFADEVFLAAEAGTGVGKTYAYLVPALIWAKQNQDKVVISTKTKALQQQIIAADLPELEKVLGYGLKYTEVKGRDNFICWHKYQQILAGKKRLEPGETDFIEAILSWAEVTISGDRKELALKQELMQYWGLIAADRNNCQRELCTYKDKCFRLKMIKNMNKADIIITNHALLLSDILVDNSILPEFEYLIIDEAHTFNKESFDRLAHRFSLYDTLNILELLFVKDKRSKRGYLFHLRSNYAHLSEIIDETGIIVEKTIKLTRQLFEIVTRGLRYGDDFNFSHIINPGDKNRKWFTAMHDIYREEYKPNFDLLLSRLRDLALELEGQAEGSDLVGIINALQEIDDTAFCIIMEEISFEEGISWMECLKGKVVAICSAGVQGGERLNQQLYQKLKALIMVSATLAIEDRFDHFIDRNGLNLYEREGKIETLLEESPFDYQRQACLYVVRDMPDPGSPSFSREANKVLSDIFAAQRGQTMVLFTSKKHMQEAAAELRPFCEVQGLNLLVQHEDGEFATLVEEFKEHTNSILMGVETFWEGIDLKGEILKCLVIVKLPFRSPADPYCNAWDRYYKMQGKNSFTNFMLPDAAVRFKQGVGRLIRSENDRGVAVVLDTRLINRRYGEVLKNSIPIKNLLAVSRKDLKMQLELWG